MNSTYLVVLLVPVLLLAEPRLAAAQTSESRPSVSDMRAALERGEAREALKMSTNALRLENEAARGYSQYELLMVRGEALLAIGLPLDAADAYEHANHVAGGLKDRAAAHAQMLLARRSAERPPAPDAAQDEGRYATSPATEPRARAMRDLYKSLRPGVEAKVRASVGANTLPPVYEVLPPLIDLGSLEMTADGTLEKTMPLLEELGEWASAKIAEELQKLDSTVTTLGASAEEVAPVAGNGATPRRGLQAVERDTLKETERTLHRLEEVTRLGRRLAEMLDDRKAIEVWNGLTVKVSDLYARVESLLSPRY